MKLLLLSLLTSSALAKSLNTRQEPLALDSEAVPPGVSFDQVTNSGSGCTRDSADISIIQGSQIIVSNLPNFRAVFGPNTSQLDRQRNCLVAAHVNYPAGWQFSVSQSSWSGWAKLDPGIKGTFYSSVYFAATEGSTFNFATDIHGDAFLRGSNFAVSEESLRGDGAWSKCGGDEIVSINNRVALTRDGAAENVSGEITANGAHNQIFTFTWRRC